MNKPPRIPRQPKQPKLDYAAIPKESFSGMNALASASKSNRVTENHLSVQRHAETIAKLSSHHEEILSLIRDGIAYDTIAQQFGIGSFSTLKSYFDQHLSEEYIRAKVERSHGLVNEMHKIILDTSNDLIFDENTGRQIANPSSVARAKLQCDVLRWMAQCANRQEYGDKPDTTLNVTLSPLELAFKAVVKQGSAITPRRNEIIDVDQDS